MRDDITAGVKSTAILFGNWIKTILAVFAAIFVVALTFAGTNNHQGPAFYLVSVCGASLHLVWQLRTLDVDNPPDCLAKFLVSDIFLDKTLFSRVN
jgi:4-hydroxybenzoate polyprenyltransferase